MEQLQYNDDGTVDLYVGPDIPEGMGKATSPHLALRFFQFEEALQAEIKNLITKNIPVLENY